MIRITTIIACPIRLTFCEGIVGRRDQTINFFSRLLCEKATFSVIKLNNCRDPRKRVY